VLNAVPGVDTIPLLTSIGADNLDGTVLWDTANASNPDFSLAIPDDSLGRRIQEAFPAVKVVKRATTSAPSWSPTRARFRLPRRVPSGDHTGAKGGTMLQELGTPYFNITIVKAA
jgi:hypothetical protein